MGDFWNRIVGHLDGTMLLAILGMAVLMFLFSRTGKKAAAAREADRQSWLKVGADVVTASGFLGKIVDIDGEAVTLQSPGGEESVWLKPAINRPMEIPLAPVSESEQVLEANDHDSAHDQATEDDRDTVEPDAAHAEDEQGKA